MNIESEWDLRTNWAPLSLVTHEVSEWFEIPVLPRVIPFPWAGVRHCQQGEVRLCL